MPQSHCVTQPVPTERKHSPLLGFQSVRGPSCHVLTNVSLLHLSSTHAGSRAVSDPDDAVTSKLHTMSNLKFPKLQASHVPTQQ